jgi:hypothetical protein
LWSFEVANDIPNIIRDSVLIFIFPLPSIRQTTG